MPKRKKSLIQYSTTYAAVNSVSDDILKWKVVKIYQVLNHWLNVPQKDITLGFPTKKCYKKFRYS